MTNCGSGKQNIRKRLMTLLFAGNSLVLVAVGLGDFCFEPVRFRVSPDHPFSIPIFAAALMLIAALGVVLFARVLCSRIDSLICAPIDQLVRTMEIVSHSRDYSVRVQRRNDDELGRLYDCFNHLLAEVALRDEQLALHSSDLELKVADRTREICSANKQLSETLDTVRGAMQTALAASRAKSDFLAHMSHEIRTPMYGVLGMTELLQATVLNNQQSRYLQRIRHSGEALLAIINDILDFSKIEAGKMDLEQIPFDLHELVHDTVDLFSEDARAKGLELTADIAGNLPRSFRGDPGRLRQVMVNLIGNALKFTPAGSVGVTVFWERAPSLVRVSVCDTGIGITEEARSRILDRFSQGDESTTRRHGGTGLGLAIVRQLTELMGGKLCVTSEPGKGSTFSFTVSLQPLTEQQRVPSDQIPSLLHGRRALVVSEDPATCKTLRRQLTEWGMDVECAVDVAGALGKLMAPPVDLAIIDRRIADTDGIELAASIGAIMAGHAIGLLLLADEELEEGNRAPQHGIFTFLRKSLSQHGFYWVLVRVLGIEPTAEVGGESIRPLARKPNVLLVEDHPVNREIGQAMLEKLGCSVGMVDNGRSALEAVQERAYDLIFMDCEMPIMDGLEATRRIREWEASRRAGATGAGVCRIPIIALTAYAMKEDRLTCLAAGADDYLSKPCTCEQFSLALNRHLPQETAGDRTRREVAAKRGALDAISRDKMAGALEMIRTLPGNQGMEILRRVVDLFLSSTPDLLQTLREAESGGDAPKLKAAAHRIKSSSANLGAMKLADACRELEMLGRAGSTEGALPLLVQVEEEYKLVREALQGGSLC